MTKTKEDAVLLLGQIYEVQQKLTKLCSEFDFETKEDRHVFSRTVGYILCAIMDNILVPLYEKYPELTHPSLISTEKREMGAGGGEPMQ